MNKELSNRELSNEEWLAKTKKLIADERQVTLAVIECLEVISNRMIYAELGYGSLFEFCVRYLNLSEGSAHRRISAMRLSREVPEVKTKLMSGELSLSNAAKIESATRKTSSLKKELSILETRAKKSEIVDQCLNLSQKECELKLFTLLPESKEQASFTEKRRVLNEEYTELKLLVSHLLSNKLNELQDLLSHSDPSKSILKLFEKLIDEELERQKKKRSSKVENEIAAGISEDPNEEQEIEVNSTQIKYKGTYSAEKVGIVDKNQASAKASDELSDQVSEKPENHPIKRQSIPARVKKLIWTRAAHHCQFPGCTSRYRLEIEHKVPIAMGGTNDESNLMLLCKTHNLLRAKQVFGARKMGVFVHRLALG